MSTDQPAPNPITPRRVEHFLGRLARYPVATLQILFYLLIAWGVVGGELGAGDLFWHEHRVQQFFVGAVVCLLFGTVLVVTVLLLPPRNMPGTPPDDYLRCADNGFPTLLPGRDPGVRRTGRRLLQLLLAFVVVLYLGKHLAVNFGSWGTAMRQAEQIVRYEWGDSAPRASVGWWAKASRVLRTDAAKEARAVFAEQSFGGPFFCGYLFALVVGFGVGYADAKFGWREQLARRDWFRRGFNHPSVLIPTDPHFVPAPRGGRFVTGSEALAFADRTDEAGTADAPAHELCAAHNLRSLIQLHAAAVVFAVLIGVLLAVALLLTYVLSSHSPVVLISLFLILLNMVGGFVAFRFPYYRMATVGFIAYLCFANMSAGFYVHCLFGTLGIIAVAVWAERMWAFVGTVLVFAVVGAASRDLPDAVPFLVASGAGLGAAFGATSLLMWATQSDRLGRNVCRTFGVGALACLGIGNKFGCQMHPATYDGIGWADEKGGTITSPQAYDHPRALDPLPAPNADVPLIRADALLKAHGAQGTNGKKPRLVLVAVSGGGIRASVWTAVVLDGLKSELRDVAFDKRVRIITGASGGMVGAAAYVACDANTGDKYGPVGAGGDGRCDRTGLSPLAGSLARDALSPVAQTMIVRDFTWNTLFPNRYRYERGRTLESAWEANFTTGHRPDEVPSCVFRTCNTNPFARPMRELYADEAACKRASLIFAPVMVEDTKRLLVSNLDLDVLTLPEALRLDSAHGLLGRTRQSRGVPPAVPFAAPLSRPAVEFFRLFPKSDTFSVGSAARMSASFPIVSPAVPLPTEPVRRVVDGGYYDNYGIDILSNWLLANKDHVVNNTSGVLVVQVRAYPLETGGMTFEDGSEGALDLLIGAISAPMSALTTARGSAAYHRNNQQLAEVHRTFNADPRLRPDFFATTVFELQRDAALSWYLTTAQKRQVAEGFYERDGNGWKVNTKNGTDTKIRAIRNWFQDK